MKELQIVSFEQAQRLKAAGFDWLLKEFYNPRGIFETEYTQSKKNWNKGIYISAPTTALALKWMRDVKNVQNGVMYYETIDGRELHYYGRHQTVPLYRNTKSFDTHEEAESALLDGILNDLDKSDKISKT